ncbi:uncharacterized protein LOC107398838 [Tribolium castaneum]|nr:PREDICTED: uncharacterized protein LOC107398838 isoform X2 [Tribolium castaneum]|eukprot:XP_015839844.1 PREDICTED: uncharacterized protein LOC107398838 isoform X2 [Tribolium castaneum]
MIKLTTKEFFALLWSLSKFFGMTPVYIKRKKLIFTKLSIFCCLTWLTICVTSLLMFYNQMSNTISHDFVKMKSIRVVLAIHSAGMFVLMVLIIVFVFINWAKVRHQVTQLVLIDSELKKHYQIHNETKLILVLALELVVFNILSGVYMAAIKPNNRVVFFVIITLPRIVVSHMFVIFTTIVVVLYQNFKIVNSMVTSDPSRIRHVLLLHKSLTRIGTTINSLFSLQLLVFITINFVVLLGDLYVTLYIILTNNQAKYCTTLIGLIKNCVIVIFELYYLSHVCQNVSTEANRTKFILVSTRIDISDEKKRNLVIGNILRLMHRRFEITALRLFTIDNKLLFGIFGSVASYLFIVLQLEVVPT